MRLNSTPEPSTVFMTIRIADPSCLKPRFLDRKTSRASRIEGILVRSVDGQSLLVDAIDFDGKRCRYRAIEKDQWHTENDGDDFKSCAQTIMDRLRCMDKDPKAELSVVDSVMTHSGDMLVAIRNDIGGQCRWLPLPA